MKTKNKRVSGTSIFDPKKLKRLPHGSFLARAGETESRNLDDDAFRDLQLFLMLNPEAGAIVPGTGALRKVRIADTRRGKGKRGGLRVVY